MAERETITLASFKNYTGAVNLEYGGLFVDLSTFSEGYAGVLSITDLDSACGFGGAVMVERLTVYFDKSIAGIKTIKSALESCDMAWYKSLPHKARKMALVTAMTWYGMCDPVSDYSGPHSWIIQCEPDEPPEYDGWKADITLTEDQDLFGYLLAEGFLAEFE